MPTRQKIPAIIGSEVGLKDDLILRRRRPVLLHGGRGGRFQFLILDDGGGDRRVADRRLGPRLAVASLHLGVIPDMTLGVDYRIATSNMPL